MLGHAAESSLAGGAKGGSIRAPTAKVPAGASQSGVNGVIPVNTHCCAGYSGEKRSSSSPHESIASPQTVVS